MHPHFAVWLCVKKGVCVLFCTLGYVGLLFIVLWCWLWHFFVCSFMKKLWKKVWGICYFHNVIGFALLLSACVYASLCVIFCKLWLPWNHRGKMCLVALENVHYVFPFIFSISYGVSTMAFVYLLEKLKDMNIFLAPSIEKAQTKKMAGLLRTACAMWWRVSMICRELQNNDVNKGTTRVGFNEMPLSTRGILLCS